MSIPEEQAIQKGFKGKGRRWVAISRMMYRQNTEEGKRHGRNRSKKLRVEVPTLKKLRYPQSVQTELPLNSATEGLASKMEGVYTYV